MSTSLPAVLKRHNVRVLGEGERTLLFAHGYGCDQEVWRHVAPWLSADHRLVLFDYVGSGGSDLSAYDPAAYATLAGHADDLVAICEAARLQRPVIVGHSVSAMIGAIAAARRPDLFDALVMIAPNPCYVDDGDYRGGFSADDIDELLEELERNFFAWARMMAPVIMGNAEKPGLSADLANAFCINDPAIARHFARVTFRSDTRAMLPEVHVPTLVLQCADDALAPPEVGEYLRRTLPRAQLVRLAARGHCPHLSAPAETAAAIRAFVEGRHGDA